MGGDKVRHPGAVLIASRIWAHSWPAVLPTANASADPGQLTASSCWPELIPSGAVEVTIAEGRNREIRRLCAALGLEIERLVRVRFGPVNLGDLPSGATRPLTAGERKAIEELTDDRRQG
jgi:16S rRNA U516 pseudouridylate synthase RsuA-like enzyme